MSDNKLVRLVVNGALHEVMVEPQETLLGVLRNRLGLTGTKSGCDRGECGSCTVLMDGRPILSCMTLAVEVEGRRILTIEGLSNGSKLHPIQQAFIDNHGLQCGWCTPGVILAAKALLDENADPTEAEVREAISGNLCRCGSYAKIVKSIQAAAQTIREGERPHV